jgi:hypothetical protein
VHYLFLLRQVQPLEEVQIPLDITFNVFTIFMQMVSSFR